MVGKRGALGLLLAVLSASPLSAQDRRGVDIHGFGGWSFGTTSANRFLGADEDGEYAKTNFALKVTSTPTPAVQINAQLFVRNGFDGSSTSLDYTFADWQLHNAVHVRVGKVKHPFGIYTEVAGLGTVRPFLNLPQSVYGPIGIVSKSYRGVGLRGSTSLPRGWSLEYDVYGGGIEFEQEESALDVFTAVPDSLAQEGDFSEIFESQDVIGGRIVIGTPFDGLNLGASAFSGRPTGETLADKRYVTTGLQLAWVRDRTWLRAEYAYQRDRIPALQDRSRAYYVELAQFFGSNWQLAASVNELSSDIVAPPTFPIPEDVTRHEEVAVGVNYWVNPQFGFKASHHWVQGNVLAELSLPELYQLVLAGINANPKTRLFQFGAQFSF